MPARARAKPSDKPESKATARGQPTRERILAAAERLFAEQGFSLVSMPAIAKASGITAGAIYKHFPSKAELFFEVVRRAVDAAPLPAQAASPDADPLPRRVAAYATRRLKRVRQLAVETHYASARDPKVRRWLRQTIDRQIADIEAHLAARGAPNPGFTAPLIFVVVLGLMHMETLAPRLLDDDAWSDFVADQVARLVGER